LICTRNQINNINTAPKIADKPTSAGRKIHWPKWAAQKK